MVIHNGVELPRAAVVENRSGPYRLVTVGRLQAPKDPITLVRALAELGRPGEAVIAGDGPDRAAVESEVRRLGSGVGGSPRRRAERRRRAPGGGRPVRAVEPLRRPSALDPRGHGRRTARRGLECRRSPGARRRGGNRPSRATGAIRMPWPQRWSASSTTPRCAAGSAQRAGPECRSTSIWRSLSEPISTSTAPCSPTRGCPCPRRSAAGGTRRGGGEECRGRRQPWPESRASGPANRSDGVCRAKRSVSGRFTPGSHETATRYPAALASRRSRGPNRPAGYERAVTGRSRRASSSCFESSISEAARRSSTARRFG